jgi:uncharacterized membrane protein HdeD (DUF308 family)
MHKTHTWLWLVEVIRGIIALTFGILFFLANSFTMHVLLYILGVYLIIDGSLDVYSLATGRRHSRHKARAYLAAATSIVVGLISFVLPILTILLLAFMIAIRIVIRGVRVISDARRSRSTYVGVSWLYGGLLILSGVVLLLLPFLTIVFLFVLIGVYALCDGLYLLVRGLLLRFAPSTLYASAFQPPGYLPDLPDDLPLTTRRAAVFVRRLGADGLGHIAWAFEWNNGWFNAGSVENPTGKIYAKPAEMGFWAAHTLEPAALMRKQSHPYNEYKLFSVLQPHPKDAWRVVIWESREPYHVVRHNCNDVAYEILRTYGVTELLDPAQEYIPNDWYDALPGRSYKIVECPVIPVHLHQMSQRELASREIMLTIPPQIKGTAPPWRVKGWRAWAELILEWDKMLKDVRVLPYSIVKLVRKK